MATDDFPMSRGAIWAMCILLTPLCGAVLYYAWRKNNLAAANYANRASWVRWMAWIAVGLGLRSL